MIEGFGVKVEAALEAETQYDHGLPWAQFADRVGAEPKRRRMRAILSAAFSEGEPNSLALLNRLVRSLEGCGVQLNDAQEAAYEAAASFLDSTPAPGGAPKNGDHWSDCATNGAPALPAGPCNCGATALAEARDGGERGRFCRSRLTNPTDTCDKRKSRSAVERPGFPHPATGIRPND